MSQKNHIWPAYVDMMTVLLLVYLIINAMYSALLANADLDPKPLKRSQKKHNQAQVIQEVLKL